MNRLAAALVPLAHRALALPPCASMDDAPTLHGALDAIDGFLAQPVGSRYLAAARALDRLAKLRRRTAEVDRLARRSIDAELDRLDERALLPQHEDTAATVTRLRALPADPRAGRRLAALIALLDAHREIAIRVRAPDTLRAKLGLTHTPGKRKGERRKGSHLRGEPARRGT